jgi:phospholipid/cholesterol/gamma-HCH transport system substrate-binding protein
MPNEGAAANVDTDAVECRVINGIDPDPGDGYDENGTSIRGEQNIGRDGGRGTTTPEDEVAGESPVSATMLGDLVGGLINARAFARTVG